MGFAFITVVIAKNRVLKVSVDYHAFIFKNNNDNDVPSGFRSFLPARVFIRNVNQAKLNMTVFAF